MITSKAFTEIRISRALGSHLGALSLNLGPATGAMSDLDLCLCFFFSPCEMEVMIVTPFCNVLGDFGLVKCYIKA